MLTYSICFQLFPFKHRLIADKTVSFKILQLRFACPPTNEDMVIVDGHNRFRVCEKHGLPYKILMFSFADFLEARQWALDAQKGRRNLDKWELGKIALRLKPGIEARARENMSSGGGDQNSEGVKSGLTTLSDPIFPVSTRKVLERRGFTLEDVYRTIKNLFAAHDFPCVSEGESSLSQIRATGMISPSCGKSSCPCYAPAGLWSA